MSGSAKYHGHWHRCVALPLLLSWYWAWQSAGLKEGLIVFFGLFVGWQIFRVGYGIPNPDGSDAGSWLGRLCITPEATRAVAGMLYSLPVLIVARGDTFLFYIALNSGMGWLGSHIKLVAKWYERLIGLCVGVIIFKEEVLKWLSGI
jgi:hypothetical protein